MQARQEEFQKKYQQARKALGQLLTAADATGYAGIALFRNAQQKCKEQTSVIEKMLFSRMQDGLNFTNNAKHEREIMDCAIQTAKGTTAAMKGSVSPRDKGLGYYAVRVVKEHSSNQESKE